MPVIHPNTLFHFTRTLTNLKSILRDGLRFSYCFEEFANGHGIALPMVCFCDIPLLRTPQHRKRYGNYMIGLTKDCLQKDTNYRLNPVMYRYSNFVKHAGVDHIKSEKEIIKKNFYEETMQLIEDKGYSEFVDKNGYDKLYEKDDDFKSIFRKNDNDENYLLCSFAFSKLYATEQDGKIINNYDECEWRYIYQPVDNNNEEMWKLDIDASKFEEDKKELNKKLWENDDSRIILDKDICKYISFIVVRTDKQIEKMIKFIRNTKTIFGNSITQEQKDIIISKITSFESIETNY